VGQSLRQTLTASLRPKHLLLVLDNFEQVVAAAPLVADLLNAVPHLKVVVTSRTRLHLSGEHAFAVPPLALPDPHHLPELETLSQYAAVALFIARAQAAKPDFQVTHATAPAVAEICVRLDGLPLAIELAAARIQVLPPPALLARLSSRFRLLTGGPQDRPARQQTLRQTLDWTYALLAAPEQILFRRLGVFLGGCTLEAAEAVCHLDGDLPPDLLDGLQALLDKSLLQQEEAPDGASRFTMLETIREYAHERLMEHGERDVVQRAHMHYFLRRAEDFERGFDSDQQVAWLNRVDIEIDNVRAALHWCKMVGNGEAGLRMASLLLRFWDIRARSEGRAWLETFLQAPGNQGVSTAVRATALTSLGNLVRVAGDATAARALLEEGLALHEHLNDRNGRAIALINLGALARTQGEYQRAQTLIEHSLTLFEEIGDSIRGTWALNLLGILAVQRADYDHATMFFARVLDAATQLGHQGLIADAQLSLGQVAQLTQDFDRAEALYRAALKRVRELRDSASIAEALRYLAVVVRQQGHYQAAMELLKESVVIGLDLEEEGLLISWVASSAGLIAAREQPERAARLFGAVEALLSARGIILDPLERATYDLDVAMVRARLDEAVFAGAESCGRAMTLEQAIAYALEQETPTG
jgi:predicted ATPase